MKILKLKIDKKTSSDIQELMLFLKMSRPEVANYAMAEGIKNLKKEIAIHKYLNEEFTLARAAEFSRTSIQEMAEYLAKHGVAYFRYDPSELAKDASKIFIHYCPHLRISAAVEVYRSEGYTLSKCAEIAGMTAIEFKKILKNRGIHIRIMSEDKMSIKNGTKALKRKRRSS